MSPRSLKKIITLGLLLAALLSACAPAAPAAPAEPQADVPKPGAVVRLAAPAGPLKLGDQFSVPVQVEGFSGLTAFELHLSFDPKKLQVVAMKNGGFIAPDFVVEEKFDNTAGTIDYSVAQIGRDPAQGAGSLLEIVFLAREGGGETALAFRATSASPAGALFSDSNGQAIPADLNEVSLTIQ